MEYTDEVIQGFMESAVSVVKTCGEVIRKAIYAEKNVDQKLSETDFVTETDRMVEELIHVELSSKYPDHKFIGEESVAARGHVLPEFLTDPTWIIDPIDGTMNFVHSNPNMCISVALAINRRIVIGIIYIPVSDQLYTAIRGRGTYLNGRRVKVSSCSQLGSAMVHYEIWGKEVKAFKSQMETTQALVPRVQAFRTIGSAAICLALVAAGQSDAYMQCGIHVWDIAAGALLVQEAGGVVLDTNGGDFDFMSRRILVASTNSLAKELIETVPEQLHFDREFSDPCPL